METKADMSSSNDHRHTQLEAISVTSSSSTNSLPFAVFKQLVATCFLQLQASVSVYA